MRKVITSPLVYLFLVIVFFYRPVFLHGQLPIPADTLIGLYHPYRDLYANTNPNGIAYKNFLITDPIRQQYPWRFQVMSQMKQGRIPSWNPYTLSGTPLIGNFQSGAFYPLNIFFLFLPFSSAWGLLIILQTFLGAFFMYLYLTSLRLNKWATFLGSFCFVFSGFAIAWLEWGTIFQTILWLPLIFLSIEQLLRKITWKWILLLIIAEASMLFAGHVQTYFYALIISGVYLLAKIYLLSPRRPNMMIKRSLPFILVGIIVFVITAVQWFPSVIFIKESARNLDQINAWQNPGWFIPWQNLIQFFIPDFFGNPATGNYWGIWNYAEFIGYIGIVPLIFSLYAISFRRDKKTIMLTVTLFLSLLFALPTAVSKIPFIFHIPFLSSSQPTRLLSIIDFSLSILAALGLDYFISKRDKRIFLPILLCAFLFFGAVVIVSTTLGKIISPENILVTRHNMIIPFLFFILSSSVIGASIFIKQKFFLKLFLGLLCLFAIIDLTHFAQKFTPFTYQSYLYPQTASLQFLQKNIGNYRMMSFDSRILPPNTTIRYHLQSIEGYDPLFLERYGEFIVALQRDKPNVSPPFGFNRIITPHKIRQDFINLLGVKYVLSLDQQTNPALKKVFTEGQTIIYENTQVLPRAFFVSRVVPAFNKTDAIRKLFSIDLRRDAVVESQTVQAQQLPTGRATINSYSPEKVTIETENAGNGFLLFTDTYYDTWKASLDGTKNIQILRTDYNFRGIYIPAGKHTITFYNTLF